MPDPTDDSRTATGIEVMKTVRALIAAGALAVAVIGGVDIHQSGELSQWKRTVAECREEVRELKTDDRRDDQRMDLFAEKLARFEGANAEHGHDHHKGPAGPCVCVATGRQELVSCQAGAECDEGAIALCERLNPGHWCRPLL
jgi:hypothetical protein